MGAAQPAALGGLMPVATPSPRIGKFAASVTNPAPRNSERQPRGAAFVVASAKPLRRKKKMRAMGLINR